MLLIFNINLNMLPTCIFVCVVSGRHLILDGRASDETTYQEDWAAVYPGKCMDIFQSYRIIWHLGIVLENQLSYHTLLTGACHVAFSFTLSWGSGHTMLKKNQSSFSHYTFIWIYWHKQTPDVIRHLTLSLWQVHCGLLLGLCIESICCNVNNVYYYPTGSLSHYL